MAIVHLPILLSWPLDFFEQLTQFTSGCPRTGFLLTPARHKSFGLVRSTVLPREIQIGSSVYFLPWFREESWLHYRSRLKHEGPYITKLCQSCYYQLRQIRTVRHSLTSSAMQTFIHAFVCARVDFSNSLLYGTSAYLLDRLQSVLNSAARLILRIGKYDSISAAIRRDLHWLPVPFLIRYKLNSITSNCLAGRAPEYRAMPLREWHSSKTQPSVVRPGSAPGPSISEGTIRSTRLLRLLTTAVELTSYRHPTSTQQKSTFSGRDSKLTTCNSPCYATENQCQHDRDSAPSNPYTWSSWLIRPPPFDSPPRTGSVRICIKCDSSIYCMMWYSFRIILLFVVRQPNYNYLRLPILIIIDESY